MGLHAAETQESVRLSSQFVWVLTMVTKKRPHKGTKKPANLIESSWRSSTCPVWNDYVKPQSNFNEHWPRACQLYWAG